MGYYTCHTLSLENVTPEQEVQIINRLKEMNIIDYALTEDFDCYDSVKWYEEEKQMKQISSEFPEVHFKIHGEGENNEDIWDHHYLGGKIQRCDAKIIIPPFDPNKLRDD